LAYLYGTVFNIYYVICYPTSAEIEMSKYELFFYKFQVFIWNKSVGVTIRTSINILNHNQHMCFFVIKNTWWRTDWHETCCVIPKKYVLCWHIIGWFTYLLDTTGWALLKNYCAYTYLSAFFHKFYRRPAFVYFRSLRKSFTAVWSIPVVCVNTKCKTQMFVYNCQTQLQWIFIIM
jgi:hypothetical protein